MAYLYRLIAFVFVWCALALLSGAYALTPTSTTTYQYSYAGGTPSSNPGPPCAARITALYGGAANARMTGSTPSWVCEWSTNGSPPWSVVGTYTANNPSGFSYVGTTTQSCPANSTLVGSQCMCSGGYNESGSSCVAATAQDAENCKALADGLNFVGAPLVHYGAVGLTACFGGYVVSGTGAAAGGGQTELYGPYKCAGTSGSTCSIVPKPSSIVVTCKEGEYPGTVNGVQVCVPPSSSIEEPKTTTATPPTPGASAPPIEGAPQGTATQSEQTTCTGTSCSTTTTYKDAAGNPLGSKTEQTSKADFCADNPKAPGCAERKASFAGNCAGGFSYEGDAIQGAIAQEVYRQNCLNNATTTESALYDTEKVKTGDQTTGLSGNSSVTVSPADFDSSDSIGGAACITDRTVVVWGKSIVLPFSVVCPVMDYLRAILLAVSYLSAAGIVLNRRS